MPDPFPDGAGRYGGNRHPYSDIRCNLYRDRLGHLCRGRHRGGLHWAGIVVGGIIALRVAFWLLEIFFATLVGRLVLWLGLVGAAGYLFLGYYGYL